jgi:hypothetical protein
MPYPATLRRGRLPDGQWGVRVLRHEPDAGSGHLLEDDGLAARSGPICGFLDDPMECLGLLVAENAVKGAFLGRRGRSGADPSLDGRPYRASS